MKRVFSLLIALLLMCCAVASVSAEISPTAPDPKDYLIVDAIPVTGEAGNVTPEINGPAKVEINSGKTVTLTATPNAGYEFSHWKFIFGEFEVVEGDLTTPVIVIRPTGTHDVRAEAYFVKEGEPITPPVSESVPTLPQDGTSPITGSVNTATTTGAAVVAAIVVMSVASVVLLKKKLSA